MAAITIKGETFNVVVEGDASLPVLVLSNSLGTDLSMWDPQMPALLEHFRVLRYDSRGHGKSVVTEGPYSVAGLAQDTLAIMDALGIEQAQWMGLSMGGMIGQWLLAHAPERIGRAVLANTAAQIPGADLWNARIKAILDRGMKAVAPAIVERWFTKAFRDRETATVARFLRMVEETPTEGYAAMSGAIRDMDLREDLKLITHPVLVIVGRHDTGTPPGMGALVASAIEGAKLVTLEAAHLSNVEDAENFTHTAIEFLTAAEAPREMPVAAAPAPELPVSDGEIDEAEAESFEPERVTPEPAPKKARKPTQKKTPAKKAAAKKAPPKKPAAKKTSVKKVPAKKAAAKKAAPAKKAPVKKAAAKKTAAKKTAVKKAAPKKAAAKKTIPKKAAAKKAAIKKTPVKKVPTPKAAAKKAIAKKAAVRKTVAKKAPAKKAKKR